jgi:hypothetical protein
MRMGALVVLRRAYLSMTGRWLKLLAVIVVRSSYRPSIALPLLA